MERFKKFYFDDSTDVLEEDIGFDILSGALKLTGAVGKKLYRKIVPKSRKLKPSDLARINTNNTLEVKQAGFLHYLKMASTDLLFWKRVTKDKGFVGRFITGKQDVYVNNLYDVIVPPKLIDTFADLFDFSENFLINKISLYTMTNGGHLYFMTVNDPYEGEIDTYQLRPKEVRHAGDLGRNLKYYMAVDSKADEWFEEKAGLHFRQALAANSNISNAESNAEIDAEYTEGDREDVVDGTVSPDEEEAAVRTVTVHSVKIPQQLFDKVTDPSNELYFATQLGSKFKEESDVDSDTMKGKAFKTNRSGTVTVYRDKSDNNFYASGTNNTKGILRRAFPNTEIKTAQVEEGV